MDGEGGVVGGGEGSVVRGRVDGGDGRGVRVVRVRRYGSGVGDAISVVAAAAVAIVADGGYTSVGMVLAAARAGVGAVGGGGSGGGIFAEVILLLRIRSSGVGAVAGRGAVLPVGYVADDAGVVGLT